MLERDRLVIQPARLGVVGLRDHPCDVVEEMLVEQRRPGFRRLDGTEDGQDPTRELVAVVHATLPCGPISMSSTPRNRLAARSSGRRSPRMSARWWAGAASIQAALAPGAAGSSKPTVPLGPLR